MKYISILGSTGSIGRQTLDVVSKNEDIKVVALSADRSVELMKKQIEEFEPELVCMYDEESAKELRNLVDTSKTEILSGMEGLIEVAVHPTADMVVASVVGMIGIRPVIEAIKAGKDIAFANKETLVTAGHIIMPLIRKHQVLLLPVDSEHSAVFQCLNGERHSTVDKILLTASGGPFRTLSKEELYHVTPEDALKHPNWDMGNKITIDSSTMVNKGLEVIEARWLFDVSYERIEVLVQPQSIIHSMVQFEDGGVMAQLGTPDMRLPISYALFFPERRNFGGDRLDFGALSDIRFEKPDREKFPALDMAYSAGRTGGSMPTVFNAANEVAVGLFLERKIGYMDIVRLIDKSMESHEVIKAPSLTEILEVEAEIRAKIMEEYK